MGRRIQKNFFFLCEKLSLSDVFPKSAKHLVRSRRKIFFYVVIAYGPTIFFSIDLGIFYPRPSVRAPPATSFFVDLL